MPLHDHTLARRVRLLQAADRHMLALLGYGVPTRDLADATGLTTAMAWRLLTLLESEGAVESILSMAYGRVSRLWRLRDAA